MTCQEHMKCPGCGVKLFLCEFRGPHLEGSRAVQWDEERLGDNKFVAVRSPSSYNTRKQVGRETCCVVFLRQCRSAHLAVGEAGSWLVKFLKE